MRFLKILSLLGNITFLGLKGADPNKIAEAIESDQNIHDQVRAFFDRTRQEKPQKGGEIFTEAGAKAFAHLYQHDSRCMRNYSKLYVWIKRGARSEEKPRLEL